MPEMSPENAVLARTHPQGVHGRLFILAPALLFRARVNQTSFTYPIAQFNYDTVTVGSYTEVKPNMTVVITNDAGENLGTQRLQTQPTSSIIYVGLSSRGRGRPGELDLENNAIISIYEDFQPFPRTPRMDDDGTLYRDGNIIVQPTKPKANGGCGYMYEVDPDTGLSYPVDFDGSESFIVADGETVDAHRWDFGPGVSPQIVTTETVSGVIFPPGFRWVEHQVTASNGENHIQQIPIAIGDGATLTFIEDFEFVDPRVLRTHGQQFKVRIHQAIPLSSFPYNTLLMYCEDDYIDGVKHNLAGPSGREHMKFIGWIHTEDTKIAGDDLATITEVTLECLDVAGRLAIMPGWPLEVERTNSTAANWLELEDADMGKYYHHLIEWLSTAGVVADVILPDDVYSYDFPSFSSSGADIYQQVDEQAEAISYKLTCDQRGTLRVVPDLIIQESDERTETSQFDFEVDDYEDLGYQSTNYPRVAWSRVSALMVSTSEPDTANMKAIQCIAPGTTPGFGVQSMERTRRLVKTASQFLNEEGNRYTATYNAARGLWTVRLIAGADLGIEPALGEWVTMTITAAVAAQRGLTFTQVRCWPKEISIQYVQDPQRNTTYKVQTMQLEEEFTNATPAVDVTQEEANLPPYEEPVIQFDPPVGFWGGRDHFVPTRGVFGIQGSPTVWRISSMTGSGVKVDISPTNPLNIAQGYFAMVQDPWAYERLLIMNNYGILALDGWKSAVAPTAWDQVYIPNAADNPDDPTQPPDPLWQLCGSINRQGYFGWIEYTGGSGLGVTDFRYHYTTDNFATTQFSNTNLGYMDGFDGLPNLAIGCFNTNDYGLVIISATLLDNAADSRNRTRLAISTDWGANFTLFTATDGYIPKFSYGGGLQIPYSARGGGENRENFFYWSANGGTERFKPDGTILSPTPGGYPISQGFSRPHSATVNSFTLDANYGYAIQLGQSGEFSGSRTQDNWETYTSIEVPAGVFSCNGWPTNPNYLLLCGNTCGYLMDGQHLNTITLEDNSTFAAYIGIADLTEVYDSEVHP
jgi:hypothetical protein